MALSLLVALALPLGASAQAFRIDSEFQVNSVTASVQMYGSVASDADGDFVVVWQSYHDGESSGVFGQRFSSAGVSQAGEFQVNTYTTSFQFNAAVATDVDGDFVVVWTSRTQDGAGDGVFARRFQSSGAPLGEDFKVNTYTLGDQIAPSVATDADGDFVVVWDSLGQDGSVDGVFAGRFSSAGVSLAAEFQVNVFTNEDQQRPWVVSEGDGDFVVAWDSRNQDGDSFGVFARRFSSVGAPQTGDLQINAHTVSHQFRPSVALTPDGGFVVAWQSYTQVPADAFDIFARPFSSTGTPLAGEFQVNLHTTAYQVYPAVAIDAEGDFVVVWQSAGQDGSDRGIFARAFSSAGSPSNNEFQVNSYTPNGQYFPALASEIDGDFVVAWVSFDQDGSNQGIFAQRFAQGIALDIDGDGTTQPLTDGLLVLRFLFGFGDGVLIAGAVDADCTRCDAPAIEAYLDLITPLLNIDGNPLKEPLTDGLLVLRHLFAFSGPALVAGAVGTGCTRCDAPSIEAYLADLSG